MPPKAKKTNQTNTQNVLSEQLSHGKKKCRNQVWANPKVGQNQPLLSLFVFLAFLVSFGFSYLFLRFCQPFSAFVSLFRSFYKSCLAFCCLGMWWGQLWVALTGKNNAIKGLVDGCQKVHQNQTSGFMVSKYFGDLWGFSG